MKHVPQLEDEEGVEVEALRAISAMVRKVGLPSAAAHAAPRLHHILLGLLRALISNKTETCGRLTRLSSAACAMRFSEI